MMEVSPALPPIQVRTLARRNGSAPVPVHDHHRTPLIEALRDYRSREIAPFSTPGHKLGAGVDPALRQLLGPDLFAADVWLASNAFDETLHAAETLAADAWKADRSFFLANGSSSGNHAYLLAAVNEGDEVIVARDIHTSLLVGLILSGARPIYVAPRLHPELDVSLGIAPEDIAAALDAHPAAKLVALVSPTYWGVASDVAAIADVAHARGVPLYVDEAWGPHFAFSSDLPPSAMECGADGAVTSVHKLLAGLSQASLLNVQGDSIEPSRVAATVRMMRSTSPSLPILASLDAARRQMALDGERLLDQTITLAESVRRRLRAISGIAVLDAGQLGLPDTRYDPTRLMIDVGGLGLTGIAVGQALWDQSGIAPEMSDFTGVICLLSIADTPVSADRLVAAVACLATEQPALPAQIQKRPAQRRSSGAVIAAGPQALSPREAFFARTCAVPLTEAIGEAAAELVVPYPPGIPVLAPGEIISADKVSYLREGIRQGMHVCGPADPRLGTIRVVSGVPS